MSQIRADMGRIWRLYFFVGLMTVLFFFMETALLRLLPLIATILLPFIFTFIIGNRRDFGGLEEIGLIAFACVSGLIIFLLTALLGHAMVEGILSNEEDDTSSNSNGFEAIGFTEDYDYGKLFIPTAISGIFGYLAAVNYSTSDVRSEINTKKLSKDMRKIKEDIELLKNTAMSRDNASVLIQTNGNINSNQDEEEEEEEFEWMEEGNIYYYRLQGSSDEWTKFEE